MNSYSKHIKNNRRVIVTGGAGFIGSNLTDFLINKGYKVYVFDNLSSGKKEYINPKADFVKVDLVKATKVSELVSKIKPSAIHHVAALPRISRSVDDPIGTHDANVTATLSVLNAAKISGVNRIIFSSSSSIYGIQKTPRMNEKMIPNPISNYAIQKLMAEMYCTFYAEKFGMSIASLRYFNVYGNRQPDSGEYSLVIGKFLKAARENEDLTVYGDGKQTRDYTYIDDVVEANYKAMKYKLATGKNLILNIGFGKEVSVNGLVEIIGGKTINIKPNPRGGYEERRKYSDCRLAQKLISWKAKIDIVTGINTLKI